LTENYREKAGVALRNEFEWTGKNYIVLDEVGERCYGNKFINTKYEYYKRTEIHFDEEGQTLTLEVYFDGKNGKEYVSTVKKEKMDEKYFAAVEFNRILNEWGVRVINISGKRWFII
jgi:hypothetical protein